MPVLRVTAHLDSPVSMTAPLHFDSIALSQHPDCGGLISRSTPVGDIARPPISIHRLRLGDGWIFLSSCGAAEAPAPGREHITKRRDGVDVESLGRPFHRAQGVAKDRMLPVYTVECTAMSWLVVGRRHGLYSLVRGVSHLGAHRRHGLGHVTAWEIEPVAAVTPRDVIMDGDCARRFLPAAWGQSLDGEPLVPDDVGAVVPPYWHPGLAVPRIRPGRTIRLRADVEEALAQCA